MLYVIGDAYFELGQNIVLAVQRNSVKFKRVVHAAKRARVKFTVGPRQHTAKRINLDVTPLNFIRGSVQSAPGHWDNHCYAIPFCVVSKQV